MRWAIIKCVKIILIVGLFGFITTSDTQAWTLEGSPEYWISEAKVLNSDPCPGRYEYISVSGEGSISACVMGKNARVASFYLPQGGVGYAVSFPFENTFYRLDVCMNVWGCLYAEENDIFTGAYGGYRHLLNNLTKTVQNGVIHYAPIESPDAFRILNASPLPLVGLSVAVSNNGKWILVEAKDYGIFRVDTRTLETRRVIAPGAAYGLGRDPRMELAISNDGNTVAVMGLRMGVWVVVVDETCGDHLNAYMSPYYTGAVTACRFVNTPTDVYIPGFTYATSPRFNSNNDSLSFNANSNSVAPRHVTLFSSVQNEQDHPYYVAIGDSFTSGEGETDDMFYIGGAANRCHLSTRSYPFLLSKLWKTIVASTACSGATIDAARGMNDKESQPAQLAELESYAPQLATVGIGGNDAGLMGKLKDCLGITTCKWAETPEDRRSTAMEIKQLYPRLKDFYKDVKIRTLEGVVAVGYPLVTSSEATCTSPVGALLNQTERRFMNEAIHYLNEVIRAAAVDSGVEYADVEDAFKGRALCDSVVPSFMNEIRIGNDIAPIAALPSLKIIGNESFHPKPEGHVAVANKIYQLFNNPDSINSCANCNIPTPVPSPSTYWDSADSPSVLQRAASFLNKTIVKIGDSFEISLPSFSFAPLSKVKLELHSEVKILGEVHAKEDGSLSLVVPVESVAPGFHSLHAIGRNFSGEDVDTYDFLQIEDEGESEGVVDANAGAIPLISAASMVDTPQPHAVTTSRHGVSSEILGASVFNVPEYTTAPKGLTPEEPFRGQHGKSKQSPYILVFILGVSTVLIIVWLLFYVRYRAKHPSS